MALRIATDHASGRGPHAGVAQAWREWLARSPSLLAALALVGACALRTEAQVNDACASAMVIPTVPSTTVIDTSTATTEASDPTPPCWSGQRQNSVWFRFTAASTGIVTADTVGSNYSTVLSVYTGSCGAFTSVPNACNASGVTPFQISFTAAAGTSYWFMVSSFSGTGGSLTFHLSPVPLAPNDMCANATILGTPFSDAIFSDVIDTTFATIEPTDPVPECESGARAKSVWYRFTAPSNGVASAVTSGSSYATVLSAYSGACGALTAVSGGCGTRSDPWDMRLFSPDAFAMTAGTTYYFMVSAYNGDGGLLDFSFTFSPASFTVNSTADAVDLHPGDGLCATSTGACTLRAAVQEANAHAGPDVIFLPPGTYPLTIAGSGENAAAKGDLDITDTSGPVSLYLYFNTVISGGDPATTIIDARALGDRIFDIRSANTGLALIGLTLQNATAPGAGGAIASVGGSGGGTGGLLLRNCVVQGNQATGSGADGGGIHSTGILTLVTTRVLDNFSGGDGGGVGVNLNDGGLVIDRSAVSGNHTTGTNTDGGGINMTGSTWNGIPPSITNSTISGNAAVRSGGGIHNGLGSTKTLSVSNSTVSGNTANVDGGGISQSSGATTYLENVTVTDNTCDADANGTGDGGGIRRTAGTIELFATIVAGNTDSGSQAPDCASAAGGISSQGHNLIGENNGCNYANGTGDIVGTISSPKNPLLGPLQDNGGATQTQALLPGSPAIDAGGQVCSASDQREYLRPAGAACDIGAYEFQPAPTPTPTGPTVTPAATRTPTSPPTTTLTVTPTTTAKVTPLPTLAGTPVGACVVGSGTNASCSESALNVCLPGGGSFDGTVTFNCGGAATITVTSTKTISADTTIDGGGLITISGGNSVGVFSVNDGVKFTVQNLTIANGNSVVYGGGISNYGTLTVSNSTFSGNSANVGGGISNDGTLTVTNSTFSGNSGGVEGGGIFNYGTLTVTNSTFSGNSAVYGGGIYNFSGPVTVTNTIVARSSSGGNCAGAAVTDGGHNIDDGSMCGFSAANGSLSSTNALLDPTGLQNNGGPTQTIALCTGTGAPSAGCTGASPAINAGNESVCSTTTGAAPVDNLDQRGFVRPGTGAANCSIGAFEANVAAPAATSTPTATRTPTVTATNTPAAPPTQTRAPPSVRRRHRHGGELQRVRAERLPPR